MALGGPHSYFFRKRLVWAQSERYGILWYSYRLFVYQIKNIVKPDKIYWEQKSATYLVIG